MRVLHYIPSIDRTSGGVGAYMQLLAKELGKLVDLHVVTHRSDNELTLENCQLHYIGRGWLPWTSTKGEFFALLDELRPDVFHTNCCWLPLSALTSMWAKAKGYKVVYTPHGMLEPWIMKRHYWTKKFPAILLFQKKGLAVADLIHSTAECEKNNLMKLGWNDSICVIPNFVDLEIIDNCINGIVSESDEYITGQKCKKYILFLSRVHEKKGINFLIEAVAQLRSVLGDIRIKIAGEGDEKYIGELMDLSRRLCVDDIVEFVGGVYGDSKWKLYKGASVFVLPTYCENFGIVVAEALACGIPVITTKGTPWEELFDRNCGWWTNVDTKSIKNALVEFLCKSPREINVMGENGRMLIEEKYACKNVVKLFVEMYNRLK